MPKDYKLSFLRRYTTLGWKVLPCWPRGWISTKTEKHPYCASGGWASATDNFRLIESYLNTEHDPTGPIQAVTTENLDWYVYRPQELNWAVSAAKSHLLIIDIDGPTVWQRFLEVYRPPRTAMQFTRPGRFHLFYRVPQNVNYPDWKFVSALGDRNLDEKYRVYQEAPVEAIDLKWAGFALVTPSTKVKDGVLYHYQWLVPPEQVVAAPEWWLYLWRKPIEEEKVYVGPKAAPSDSPFVQSRIDKCIEMCANAKKKGNKRRHTLFAAGCKIGTLLYVGLVTEDQVPDIEGKCVAATLSCYDNLTEKDTLTHEEIRMMPSHFQNGIARGKREPRVDEWLEGHLRAENMSWNKLMSASDRNKIIDDLQQKIKEFKR
jgi:hypothetical protein